MRSKEGTWPRIVNLTVAQKHWADQSGHSPVASQPEWTSIGGSRQLDYFIPAYGRISSSTGFDCTNSGIEDACEGGAGRSGF